MITEESKESPQNGEKIESMFSPRFRSVAAMAGWDEEALLIASLIVEDTPDRQFKHRKRSDLHFKTPPASSRRKRRDQRRSPVSIPVTVLDLDDDQPTKEEKKKKTGDADDDDVDKNREPNPQNSDVSCSNAVIPCLDRLREELSCAICLEICFEPSTTPCGHSFCKKCLKSAADKCGKRCPKCRQLISNGRSCTVNTVLWNTIQLLFPQEIEARKAAGAYNSREAERPSSARANHRNLASRAIEQALNSPEAERQRLDRRSRQRHHHHGLRNRSRDEDVSVRRRRREVLNQDEDAALALRLQREEFMEAVREPNENHRNSLTLARENLRAMASRAINNIRTRSRAT